MDEDEKGTSIHDWLYNIVLWISLGIVGLIILFVLFSFGMTMLFALGT